MAQQSPSRSHSPTGISDKIGNNTETSMNQKPCKMKRIILEKSWQFEKWITRVTIFTDLSLRAGHIQSHARATEMPKENIQTFWRQRSIKVFCGNHSK